MQNSKAAVAWKLRTRTLDLTRPRIMGIVNVTPDSFSDGGETPQPSRPLPGAENLPLTAPTSSTSGANPRARARRMSRLKKSSPV